jgi:hypothetical protein
MKNILKMTREELRRPIILGAALLVTMAGSTPGHAAPEETRAMISINIPAVNGEVARTQLAATQRIADAATETFRISLPEIPAGEQVRLSLKARIDWPTLAGSNPFMTVQINRHALTLPDLVNKEPEFTMRDGSDTTWAYGTSWRLMYAPDFSDEVKTKPFAYGVPDTDPFGFAWDITPYLKAGENSIALTQLKVLTQPTALELEDIAVEIGTPMNAETSQVAPAPTGALPVYVARGQQKIDMTVALSKSGALQFQIGARQFSVVTRTSLPDGKWLDTGVAGSTPGLKHGQSASAQWSGDNYKVSRRVLVRDDHIEIADTITNTSPNLIGVIYENHLQLPDKPQEVLLAGRPVFSDTQSSQVPEHPTSLALWKDIAVGLVAEDDIFRVHHQAFVEPGVLGLRDDQLGLAPGASHTLEWSIYPQSRGDYWSFVNAVRRNWNSNFQIPMVAFDFPGLEEKEISEKEHCERVKARGAQWLMSNQAFYEPDEIKPDEMVRPAEVEQLKNRQGGSLVAEGTGIPYARQWISRARDWNDKVHSCDPKLKTLIYIHTQILTEPKHYEKYANDFVQSADGKNVYATYTFPLPLYLPTPENAYGKALLEAVPEILQQTQADGFYNDEMDYSTTPYDYNPKLWDGATVMIDPKTHAVTGKRSSVILLQQPWKVAFAKLLRENGKVLFGNGAPSTRTLQNLHTPRFVETASYSFLINTHFNTPLGLANHDVVRDEATRARMVRRFLDNGALMVAYVWDDEPKQQPHYLSLIYPITPEELRAGMVLGRERIVTNRSGSYGWRDGSAADVYVFDGEGRRVKHPEVKTVRVKPGVLTELRMPSDHFAVLVKRQTEK